MPSDADLTAYFEKNRARYAVPERRTVRYALLDTDQLRARSAVLRRRDSHLLQRSPRHVQTAGPRARRPHPVQDGGQDRRGGGGDSQEGRGRSEAGQEREGFRGAGQAILGGHQQGQGRRHRLDRARPDGAGIRGGGVQPAQGIHLRRGEDPVRLPHHQGDRPRECPHADGRRSSPHDSGGPAAGEGASRPASRSPTRSRPTFAPPGGSRSRTSPRNTA